jgi:hypothetical protein
MDKLLLTYLKEVWESVEILVPPDLKVVDYKRLNASPFTVDSKSFS